MNLSHQYVSSFPSLELAILIDAGFIQAWPHELRPAAAKAVRQKGWDYVLQRAFFVAMHRQGFVSSVGIPLQRELSPPISDDPLVPDGTRASSKARGRRRSRRSNRRPAP